MPFDSHARFVGCLQTVSRGYRRYRRFRLFGALIACILALAPSLPAVAGLGQASPSPASNQQAPAKESTTPPTAPAPAKAAPKQDGGQLEANDRPESLRPSPAPGKSEAGSAPLPGARVGDVIEPAAQAILDRHDKVVTGMQTLQLVSEQTERVLGAEIPEARRIQEPCRVALEFLTKDGFSMPRMSLELRIDDKPSFAVVYDGRAGLLLDHATQRAAPSSGFPVQGYQYLAALPRWSLDRRTRASLPKNQPSVTITTAVVAARVVGTETVDGEECDVVALAVSVPMLAEMPDVSKGMPEPKYFRIFETVAFARKDGLPRRIVAVSEVPGEGPLEDREVTALYRSVLVNEPIPAGLFSVKIPDGFELGAVGGSEAPATPAAPATKPAGAPK